MTEGRDISYNSSMEEASDQCEPTAMNAEDPLFILYTSGSTGAPKGFNTVRAAIWFGLMTHEYVFDYHQDDISGVLRT